MPAIPTLEIDSIDADLHEVQIDVGEYPNLKNTLEAHRAWLIDPDNDVTGRYSMKQVRREGETKRYINYYFECRNTAFAFKMRWK